MGIAVLENLSRTSEEAIDNDDNSRTGVVHLRPRRVRDRCCLEARKLEAMSLLGKPSDAQ